MKPPSRNSCWNYKATVTRVVDGDTFDCEIYVINEKDIIAQGYVYNEEFKA